MNKLLFLSLITINIYTTVLHTATIDCAADPGSSSSSDTNNTAHNTTNNTFFQTALQSLQSFSGSPDQSCLAAIEYNLSRIPDPLRLTVFNSPITIVSTTFNSVLAFVLWRAIDRTHNSAQRHSCAQLISLLLEQTQGHILEGSQAVVINQPVEAFPPEHYLHYLIKRLWDYHTVSPEDIKTYCSIFDMLIMWGTRLDVVNEDRRTPLEQARYHLTMPRCNSVLLHAIIARLESWRIHLGTIRQRSSMILDIAHTYLTQVLATPIDAYERTMPHALPPIPTANNTQTTSSTSSAAAAASPRALLAASTDMSHMAIG